MTCNTLFKRFSGELRRLFGSVRNAGLYCNFCSLYMNKGGSSIEPYLGIKGGQWKHYLSLHFQVNLFLFMNVGILHDTEPEHLE